MMRFLRSILALFARKPKTVVQPLYVPAPVACTHGVVSHRNAGDIDGMRALGIKIARLTYYVRAGDNSHWAWQLPLFDAAGIEPMLCVHDTDSIEHTVMTMARLTREYPNRLWQVGNEWNAPDWSRGNFATSGKKYATLMQRVIAACPTGTRFCGVGLAFNYAQPTYLADYLAAGGPTLEAWCIHCYGAPISLDKPVRETQAILRGKMPLWITEYGIDRVQQEKAWGPRTRDQLDTEQAKEIADVIKRAGSLGVSRTYQYCFHDDTDDGFGLVRRDGSQRPSALVFASK